MDRVTTRLPLAGTRLGTARSLTVHRYGRPGSGRKAYLQAALHADELPGTLALHHLLRLLDREAAAGRIRGEIVIVPLANPIGSAQFAASTHLGRRELQSGLDFNRHWFDLHAGLRAAVEGALTQDAGRNVVLIREALRARVEALEAKDELASLRRTLASLACDADILLDLHCDDDSLQHVYMMPQHWPAGADLVAELGARACMLCDDSGSACFDETYSLPWTRLHKEIGDRFPIPPACFAATVEFRGQADVFDELAEADARGLLRFLMRRGLVEGDPGPLPAPLCEAAMLDAVGMVEAPAAGILAYKLSLGATVARGDLVAELVDPLAEDPAAARLPLRAGTDGLLVARCLKKLVGAGDQIAMIVGARTLDYRQKKLMVD